MQYLALALTVALSLCPAGSWAQATGADAFSQRDFATAQRLWQQEAAAGSADAMLGLGLLADRGYAGSRDFAVAFDWYLQAAEMGLAEAQFNIAVMYDAGLGRDRDAVQAVVWYTRAALRGHPRAQYNLGLLYEIGDGIDANANLAGYWFHKAASTVPAAAAKTIAPDPRPTNVAFPNILFARVGPTTVEIIWTATPAMNPSYVVEIMDGADDQAPVFRRATQGSGLLLDDVTVQTTAIWRIVNLSADAADYAATPWQGFANDSAPKGRITFVVDDALPQMAAAVTIFADDLRASGYWVTLRNTPLRGTDDKPETFISYGFAADKTMAETVSRYLPGSPDQSRPAQPTDTVQPGEIVVNLAAL